MHAHAVLRTFFALLGLSLVSSLSAQNQPRPPTVGDLKEEQRIINNAYLAVGEGYMHQAKEQYADSQLRLTLENGLYAVEMLSRARSMMDQHPRRIEQARGDILGLRASESTREELRQNLSEQITPRFFKLQEGIEALANTLAAKGDFTLQQALSAAKVGNTSAVVKIMGSKGLSAKGPDSGDTSADSSSGPAPAAPVGPIPGIPGATAIQAGPNQVSVNIPGVGVIALNGTLSADGRSVDTAEYGRVDLSSGQLLPDGSVAFQTDKGVLIRGRDGKFRLIAGAHLNADGTITTADGKTVPAVGAGLDTGGAAGPAPVDPGKFSGQPPAGVTILDQNGNRITETTWENGERTGIKTEYIGGKGATLVSETKVTSKLVQANGSEWHASVTPGESRAWSFSIKMGEQKSDNGTVQLTLTVADGGGSNAFKIKSWDITDDKGDRATVNPSATNSGEATATFTKGGDYTFTVSGETDWGSPFRVKGQGGVYP